ncbi:hypothetical protein D3C78_1193610 [compost metagenome]
MAIGRWDYISETVDSRNRAQWLIHTLPTTTTVRAVVDNKERFVLSQLGYSPISSCKRVFSAPRGSERSHLICAFRRQNVPDVTIKRIQGFYRLRLTSQFSNHEQPPSALGNAVVGGINDLLMHVVLELLQCFLQLTIARPRFHMHNVFQGDPARLHYLRISDDLESSITTLIRTWLVTTGAGVVGALRGGDQQIYRPCLG